MTAGGTSAPAGGRRGRGRASGWWRSGPGTFQGCRAYGLNKLRKKITKARKRLLKADATTREQKVAKLVAKAETLLGKARLFLGIAVDRGLVSPACGATLGGLIGEVELCVGVLPVPTS